MSQKASPTLIGAFVLVGVVLAIIAVMAFGTGDLFKTKVPCVMFFDGNINGLTLGAKVKVRGVPVGSVVGIDMPVKISDGMARIPVYAELSQARTYTRESVAVTHDLVAKIVEDGLKARLDTESFLTGVLYVDLDFQPGEPAVLIGGGPEGYVEIPTLPSRVGEVIRKLTSALAEVDLKEMIDSITSAAKGIDELVRSPRIDQGFTSADQTLTRYRELAQTLDANVKTLSKELQSTLETARGALEQTKTTMKTGDQMFNEVHGLAQSLRSDSKELSAAVQRAAGSVTDIQRDVAATLKSVEVLLDPDAPIVQQLRETLWQLGRASHNLAEFADELQRNPSVLVRGRDVEGK